jgi:hypothetical protein
MWANSNEPTAMGKLLWIANTPLPTALAVQIAERAAQELMDTRAPGPVDAIMRKLERHLAGQSDDSIFEISHDVENEQAGTTGRTRSAWATLYSAAEAVRLHWRPELQPMYRLRMGMRAVVDTAYHARAAGVPSEWLADLLRPFGPPSLERIIEALQS